MGAVIQLPENISKPLIIEVKDSQISIKKKDESYESVHNDIPESLLKNKVSIENGGYIKD